VIISWRLINARNFHKNANNQNGLRKKTPEIATTDLSYLMYWGRNCYFTISLAQL